MKSNYQVAIGPIFTESIHLAGTLTDLSSFERTELRRDRQVLAVEDGVVGGALSELRHKGAEIVPLLVAGAVPGGVLTRQCYSELRRR